MIDEFGKMIKLLSKEDILDLIDEILELRPDVANELFDDYWYDDDDEEEDDDEDCCDCDDTECEFHPEYKKKDPVKEAITELKSGKEVIIDDEDLMDEIVDTLWDTEDNIRIEVKNNKIKLK